MAGNAGNPGRGEVGGNLGNYVDIIGKLRVSFYQKQVNLKWKATQ